jgi:DsbC/DsbD-like thiol-disulfide interchange protein
LKIPAKLKRSSAALLLAGATAVGQRPFEVVKWNASVTKEAPASVSVSLSATIQDGWHVYALSQPSGGPTPLRVTVPAGAPYALQAPVAETKVTRHQDPAFKMEAVYYQNAVDLSVDLKKQGAAGSAPVPIDVRFQACNDRLCLPPYTAHLTAQKK